MKEIFRLEVKEWEEGAEEWIIRDEISEEAKKALQKYFGARVARREDDPAGILGLRPGKDVLIPFGEFAHVDEDEFVRKWPTSEERITLKVVRGKLVLIVEERGCRNEC